MASQEYVVYLDGYGTDYLDFYMASDPEDAANKWRFDYPDAMDDGDRLAVIATSCAVVLTRTIKFEQVKHA